MRLKKVTGTPFTCTCVKCGKKDLTGDETKDYFNRPITQVYYADLDGKPFTDYYCNDCAKNLGVKELCMRYRSVAQMKLDCILDTCPKDSQFVNMFKCSKCSCNELDGWNQPTFGNVSCNNANAIHKPNYERWQNIKSCGSEILSVRLTKC